MVQTPNTDRTSLTFAKIDFACNGKLPSETEVI